MSSPGNATRSNPGEPVDDVTEELDGPRPAPPAREPAADTGATASERATAQAVAELSDR